MSELTQKQFRALKCSLTFFEIERLRQLLSHLRKNTSAKDFHAICDNMVEGANAPTKRAVVKPFDLAKTDVPYIPPSERN